MSGRLYGGQRRRIGFFTEKQKDNGADQIAISNAFVEVNEGYIKDKKKTDINIKGADVKTNEYSSYTP